MVQKSVFISVVLSIVALCAMCAHAQQTQTSGSCAKENTNSTCTWSYDTTSKTLTITGSGAMADYQQNTHPWPDKVSHVEIAEGITSIGNRAFQYTSISEINIPNTVTSIGDGAFDFSSLSKINIPDSVQTIGFWAFRGATSLTEIVVPPTVRQINEGAFSYCTKLQTLTISDSTQLFGDIFYIASTDANHTDTEHLTVYCIGNTSTCDQRLTNIGYSNLKTIAATTKTINGVTYMYDTQGHLIGTSGTRQNKRIYTVEEANNVVGKKNKVMIRYK